MVFAITEGWLVFVITDDWAVLVITLESWCL